MPEFADLRALRADAVIALVMRTATSSKPVCAVEVVLRYAAARAGAPREESEL